MNEPGKSSENPRKTPQDNAINQLDSDQYNNQYFPNKGNGKSRFWNDKKEEGLVKEPPKDEDYFSDMEENPSDVP
jgi:hypothetical protein